MKAMGYAQKVVESISSNGSSGIKYTTVTSGSKTENTVDLSGLHVSRATYDGKGLNINYTYAKKSDGLITDLSIGSGVYSFYKYNSNGDKVYTSGIVDSATYIHSVEIYKKDSTRVFLTIVNKSSTQISLAQLAKYTSTGARIMCSGYVGDKVVSAIKYAGQNSVYAIEGWKGKQDTYIIDNSCTISDTVRSI